MEIISDDLEGTFQVAHLNSEQDGEFQSFRFITAIHRWNKIVRSFNTLIIRITGGDVYLFWDFERPPAPYFDPPFIFFIKSKF